MKPPAGAGWSVALRMAASALGLLTIASAAFLDLAWLTGFSDPELLASLRIGGAEWWQRPAFAHVVALLCLLAAIPAGLELALGSWMGAALCLAAGLATAPFVPLVWPHQDRLDLIAPAVLTLLIIARARLATRATSLASWYRKAGWEARLAALAGALLVAFAFSIEFQELRKVQGGTTDFVTFYRAAMAVNAGTDPYSATAGAYLYPPSFAWLFIPLTALTKTGASLLWFLLRLILFGASWILCYRGLEGERFPSGARVVFAAGIALVALRFLMTDLQYGNTNILVLFLMLAALHADMMDRAPAAGLLLALAISVKVVPALLAGYFVARRRWRTLLWLFLGLVVVNAAPWLSEGPRFHANWSAYGDHAVRGRLAAGDPDLDNQSLWGALARSLPRAPEAARTAWLLLSALAGIAALVVTARARLDRVAQRLTAASAFFLLMLLVSPGSWVAHYTAVLLPMSAVLRHLLERRWRPRVLVALFIAANVVFTAILWITRAACSDPRTEPHASRVGTR